MNGVAVPHEIVEQFEDWVWVRRAGELQTLAGELRARLQRLGASVPQLLAPQLDETLALAFQKGFFPNEAFTELYNRYWRQVGCWLARFGVEANEAFDLAQGVFLNFYRLRLQTYDPGQPFARYLQRAAHHLWVAKVVRRRHPDPTADFDTGTAPGRVEDEASHRELQARLSHALARLPDEQRRVMELTLEGQKPADIAPVLGIATLRVCRLLWKARNTLAEELNVSRPATNRGRKPRPERAEPDGTNPEP
jgi:RNA polymerase sigma factor (sigma-70 family)